MVLCYHPSSHSDGLRDVPADFLSITSCSQWQLARPSWPLPLGGARTVERQDELRGVWLGVRALGAKAAHEVGEGELPDRRAGDHVVGAAVTRVLSYRKKGSFSRTEHMRPGDQ